MTTPAAFQGDFVDLRFVKGRKVCQIVIEIPIEAGTSFVAAFGTPDPASTVPVAIARLDPNAKPERKGGRLAQKAGILCNEGSFAAFLKEEKYTAFNGVTYPSPEMVANFLREYCVIESRADLDHNDEAAAKFKDLEANYRAWLTVAE